MPISLFSEHATPAVQPSDPGRGLLMLSATMAMLAGGCAMVGVVLAVCGMPMLLAMLPALLLLVPTAILFGLDLYMSGRRPR